MNKIGTGKDGELTFLDAISILSFVVGIQNLDLNVTQHDLQEESAYLDGMLQISVKKIHDHLSVQDSKLNIIMETLRRMEASNESNTDAIR